MIGEVVGGDAPMLLGLVTLPTTIGWLSIAYAMDPSLTRRVGKRFTNSFW
ncbi:MAG: hypothetical protein AAFP90_07005 [Planctomycetota bacterium]